MPLNTADDAPMYVLIYAEPPSSRLVRPHDGRLPSLLSRWKNDARYLMTAPPPPLIKCLGHHDRLNAGRYYQRWRSWATPVACYTTIGMTFDWLARFAAGQALAVRVNE